MTANYSEWATVSLQSESNRAGSILSTVSKSDTKSAPLVAPAAVAAASDRFQELYCDEATLKQILEQSEIEEAIRVSAASIADVKTAPAPKSKTVLAQVPSASALVELHKLEEKETAKVLDIQQTKLKSVFAADTGLVTIEGVDYYEVDRGSTYGGHSNLCFYLSVCGGDPIAALALKARLAPHANQRARTLGHLVDFGALDACAEADVCMEYVKCEHRPLCVANRTSGVTMLYTDDKSTGTPLYLHLRGGHYTSLVTR